MGKAKKTKKFAAVKRMINPKDSRLKNTTNTAGADATKHLDGLLRSTTINSSMFFQYNLNLVPPYQVIVDTNFLNFSIQHKLDVLKGMMDCLVAKCIPYVTDCVVAELEKLGHRYRLALRLAKDPRFVRLSCSHSGTYADDCIVKRVTEHKCYLVATNDKDLKRRIRKIPGVPILSVANHKYKVERLPDTITSLHIK